MKQSLLNFCLLLFVVTVATWSVNGHSSARTYQFINGQWFDGTTFKTKTFYSVNGLFSTNRPKQIDETVDLKNDYVIPPLADAHCHHFDGAYNIAQQIKMYLKDGVFYAKVQTNLRTGAAQVKDKVNNPLSVDVSYAHGALTHTYGHGIEIYEALALNLFNANYQANIPKIAASRIRENDAYYIIDTAADLENKWPKILAGKPDFLKIYLTGSEEFEAKRAKIPNIELGHIGLDPKLAWAVVKKAHQAGLRVSAHVDTLTDYRIALKAGVDEMAHLPGYYVGLDQKPETVLLTEAEAKETAKRKIWVVPAPVFYGQIEPAVRAKTDEALKHNLKLLKKHKVNLALGSDRYGSTPLDDVLYLQKLGVYSNLELLKIWTEKTPDTIFPNRKIGKLAENYEASFIVLGANPVTNLEAVKNITYRFKQGYPIQIQ